MTKGRALIALVIDGAPIAFEIDQSTLAVEVSRNLARGDLPLAGSFSAKITQWKGGQSKPVESAKKEEAALMPPEEPVEFEGDRDDEKD